MSRGLACFGLHNRGNQVNGTAFQRTPKGIIAGVAYNNQVSLENIVTVLVDAKSSIACSKTKIRNWISHATIFFNIDKKEKRLAIHLLYFHFK